MKLSDLENQAQKLCSSLGITLYDIELRKEKVVISIDRNQNPLNLDELSSVSSALTELIEQDTNTTVDKTSRPKEKELRQSPNQKATVSRNTKLATSDSSNDACLDIISNDKPQLFDLDGEEDAQVDLSSGDMSISLELLTLEVTTPGVERHLKRREHFTQVVGKRIALKLKPAIYHKRRIWGVLERIDGDTLFLKDVNDIDSAEPVSKTNKSSKIKNSAGGKGKASLAVATDTEQPLKVDDYLSLPGDKANAISSLEHASVTINIKDIESANLYFDWRAVFSEKNSDVPKDLLAKDSSDATRDLSNLTVNDKENTTQVNDQEIGTSETINNLKKMDNADRRAGNE